MIRICFLRTDIDLMSGATTATLALAEALAQQPEYQVHIVSIYGEENTSGTTLAKEEDSSIKYYRLNPKSTRLRESFFAGVRKFREYVCEHAIAIVCSVGMSPAYTMLLALRGLNAKRVLIEHSSRSNKAEYGYKDDLAFRLITKKLNAIVVLTHRDQENYLSLYRVLPEKVHVIPNWVSEKTLASAALYDARENRLITVGRASKVKGYDLLVKVAALLKTKVPGWTWNLYGDGEMFDEVASWVHEADLEDFVILKGNDPEVLKRYQEHSIFVMTSYFEGLPLALLEARANHLPAVAFDCPTGPREAIDDGVDGFLIPCYETEIMAERLAELMNDEALRIRFSEASAQQVEKFSKDKVFAKWLDLFAELVKE
jgi:glycosyltransferase involved in cell wall biosynthesis